MFFQKKVGEQWVDVDESYYTDKGGSTWPNIIWFRSVSDSGLYRLKYYRYTATDNEGKQASKQGIVLPICNTKEAAFIFYRCILFV